MVVVVRPLTLESHFFAESVIAIFASESFCEMERSRLWGADLMIGEAALVLELSKGSELRKACVAGDCGVRGGKGASGLLRAVEPMYIEERGGCERRGAALTGRFEVVAGSFTEGDELRDEPVCMDDPESERSTALLFPCINGLLLVDGIRVSTLMAGDGERVDVIDEGATINE